MNIRGLEISGNSTLLQLFRFGLIGGSATALNFVTVVFLVELFKLHPLTANVFAFLSAFCVSYTGHQYWTFMHNEINHRKALRRFFTVSVVSFTLNEGLFFLFLSMGHLHYTLALLFVLLIVPPLTFLFSKFWAFR